MSEALADLLGDAAALSPGPAPEIPTEGGLVHFGDSLPWLMSLPPETVGAVITDPPYSSGGLHRSARAVNPVKKYLTGDQTDAFDPFDGDMRDQRSMGLWITLWAAAALRATIRGGCLLCFTDWRQLAVVIDAVQAGGWVYRGITTWRKPSGSARPKMGGPWGDQEYAIFATRGEQGDARAQAIGCRPGVIDCKPPKDRIHPTQKPVDLMRELVRYALPGEIVCDPFAGSGTTGVAAILEGRRFIGAESSAQHIEQARSRVQAATREVATRRRA